MIFVAQNKINDIEEEKEEEELHLVEYEDTELKRRYMEENNNFYDFDDEIDEFKQLTMDLEPKYQQYAKWRI